MPSFSQLRFENCSRQEILEYFENTWTLTEILFSGLKGDEAYYRPPYHQLRHPLIFYFGHPAALYVNKLRVCGLIKNPVNAYFENIFEVGVDEMSWDDMSKNEMKWPTVAEVVEYRAQVHSLIRDLILNHPAFAPAAMPITQRDAAWALVMGFEHERIHLETSSVLMRELPLRYIEKPARWPLSFLEKVPSTQPNRMIRIDEGEVECGKPHDEPTFGWDNEYGHRKDHVPAFEISSYLASNREFLEFVIDGGYREPRYWTEEGWKWRAYRNTKWPAFWISDGPAGLNQFKLRSTFEELPFDGSLPAIVNFHEAQAYCQWLTERRSSPSPFRLLRESEQLRVRQVSQAQGEEDGVWNLGLRFGTESPVHAHTSRTEDGKVIGDVFGNVWQWSSDVFSPLPGFSPHRFYEDFSTPCFDGRHQMIFGGSFASTGDMARKWARFHFRPHFFQHAGFRVARSIAPSVQSGGVPEGSPLDSASKLRKFKNSFRAAPGLTHLNNAGLAPISKPAYDSVLHWTKRLYEEGMHCNDDYLNEAAKARESFGRLIGCGAGEIAFFQSTAGAVSQVAFGMKLREGDEIVTWDQEYSSHLYPWREAAARSGATLRLVESEGMSLRTPLEKLIAQVNERTRVIAVSWVQFQTGAVAELESLAKFSRSRGIWLTVDVIQGLGILPFDFEKLGIDAVYGGSHKWLTSPVGLGFLAVRQDRIRELTPLMIGAYTFGTCDDPVSSICVPKADALKFEAGSKQVLEIIALGASSELLSEVGVETIRKETERLATLLRSGLADLGFEIHAPHAEIQKGSIVNFSAGPEVEKLLRDHRISFARRGPGIRLSPHAFNSDEDIARVLNLLKGSSS